MSRGNSLILKYPTFGDIGYYVLTYESIELAIPSFRKKYLTLNKY